MNKDTIQVLCTFLDVDDICRLRSINKYFSNSIPNDVIDQLTKNKYSKWKSMCKSKMYKIHVYTCEFSNEFAKWDFSSVQKCKLLRAIFYKYPDFDNMVKRAFNSVNVYEGSRSKLYPDASPIDGVLQLKLRNYDNVSCSEDRISMRVVFKIQAKRSTKYGVIGNIWVPSKLVKISCN